MFAPLVPFPSYISILNPAFVLIDEAIGVSVPPFNPAAAAVRYLFPSIANSPSNGFFEVGGKLRDISNVGVTTFPVTSFTRIHPSTLIAPN